MRRIEIAVLSLALSLASAAHAGVVIELVERDAKSGKTKPEQVMYVQGGLARFESSDGQVTIFKGEALTILDPDERSYTVVDRAAIERMASSVNDAMAKMRAQMAGVPPPPGYQRRDLASDMPGGR